MKKVLLKKIVMIILVSILTTLIVFSLAPNIFADDGSVMPKISDIENGGKGDTASSMQKIVGAVLYIIKIVAIGVALIMLAVLAMKYMTSAPSDRATIKKHAVVYVVGAIVLFGAAGILNIIENFATKNIPDPS